MPNNAKSKERQERGARSRTHAAGLSGFWSSVYVDPLDCSRDDRDCAITLYSLR